MLVVLVIVKITTVLLDVGIDTEDAGIHLLHAEIISLELTINLPLLGAASTSDPNTLHLLATDNMVPVRVRATVVLLGQREHGGLLHAVGEVVGDLLPKLTGLARECLELILKILQGLGEELGALLESIVALLEEVRTLLGPVVHLLILRADDLLEGRGGRRSGSHQQCGGNNSHSG